MSASDARTLALNLDLGGRHASARVELLESPGAPCVAHVALRGWIDRRAERALEQALDALAPRTVSRVVLDCSCLRRLENRQAARLVRALSRLERGEGPIEVWGLPPRVGVRLGAAGPRVRCWPSAGSASEGQALEPSGEAAT
jgi:anti-anti-sigma regulatory factor